MRTFIVAGNWKMNTSVEEGKQLAQNLVNHTPKLAENQKVILTPPFLHLSTVDSIVKDSQLDLAAQNCHFENNGAYTGEISPKMLADFGLNYVILGHSERRTYFGETGEILKKKVDQALSNNLSVIFCIGESLEQRESGDFKAVLLEQLKEAVFHLNEETFKQIILAYEPVWAIGTGVTASAEQAEEVHAFIREELSKMYSKELADSTTILYGGSCKPSNANEIFAKPNVDGGLIGGAALKSEDFIGIIDALIAQKG